MKSLHSEMEVMVRTDHNNLMRTHEILEDAANFNFVLEPMRGGSLDDKLKL